MPANFVLDALRPMRDTFKDLRFQHNMHPRALRMQTHVKLQNPVIVRC